jgi:DASS family divalent anion:Na+ symporter
MYGPFLALSVASGAPPLISGLVLGFLSSLFGGLTHYASGPAPILYAEQHVDIKTWWKVGFAMSFFYIAIWLGLGSLWWSLLGHI